MNPVAAIIATCNRPVLLVERSAPSALSQTVPPARLVIVNDGLALASETTEALHAAARASEIPLTVLRNSRSKGAGGAWNTGLAHLAAVGHRGFVALLDDDDAWDADHLGANIAASDGSLIVVSGLRMVLNDCLRPRELITRLDARDFLVGNPGWQGSNTFVDMSLFLNAGGFREGLASLNDRDLAYRLLSHASGRTAFTKRWTSTWYASTPGNLSTPGSRAKIDGLGAFWRLYEHVMKPEDRVAFFQRAHDMFGVSEHSIRNYRQLPPPLGFAPRNHD